MAAWCVVLRSNKSIYCVESYETVSEIYHHFVFEKLKLVQISKKTHISWPLVSVAVIWFGLVRWLYGKLVAGG